MINYYDKHGVKIEAGMTLRDDSGNLEKVYPCNLMSNRKIIIMNGRAERDSHLYVGAYSKADASRLLSETYSHMTPSQWLREINIYFSHGCWGNAMDGIKPERGIWVQDTRFGNVKRLTSEVAS